MAELATGASKDRELSKDGWLVPALFMRIMKVSAFPLSGMVM